MVDPAFTRAIVRYTADRSHWLIRREMVRRRRDLQIDAATGTRRGVREEDEVNVSYRIQALIEYLVSIQE